MYARQLSFTADSAHRPEIEQLADKMFAYMKTLEGFVSVHFLISEDEASYGSISLWESESAASSAGELLTAKSSGALQKLALAPPSITVYQVYKPG